jgi:hypothetical protein
MPAPATFATARQFVGIALEATPGTPIAMSNTVIVEKFDWEDKPKWLDDKGWRGSMTTLAGRQQGVLINDFSMSGQVFGDVLPFQLANIFGDLVGTGTTTTPTTTLSAGTSAGATTLTTAVTIPLGTTIQIDVGNLSEIRKTGTPTGSGPFTIPLGAGERPLQLAHLSGVAVTAVVAPFVNSFSLNNNGATPNWAQGQPPTHTITHYQGVTATLGARQFPGACCSELSLEFNAETELAKFDSKWMSWPSVAAGTLPVAAPSSVLPIASWRGALGFAGPASGGTQVKAVPSGKVSFKRKLEPDYTIQGLQTPYIIQRGELEVSGEYEVIAADEAHFAYMMNNTQPQFQFLLSNGLGGASLILVQVDMSAAAIKSAKMEQGKENIRYKLGFDGIATATNAGASGGISPAKIAVTNAVPANTYM